MYVENGLYKFITIILKSPSKVLMDDLLLEDCWKTEMDNLLHTERKWIT